MAPRNQEADPRATFFQKGDLQEKCEVSSRMVSRCIELRMLVFEIEVCVMSNNKAAKSKVNRWIVFTALVETQSHDVKSSKIVHENV